MFREIRYQTGEIADIAAEMKKGNIPCLDVDNNDELEWFIGQIEQYGIYRINGLNYDKKARDMVKEPEFEFRVSFYSSHIDAEDIDSVKGKLMYIDVYFEPEYERTYDSVGEI